MGKHHQEQNRVEETSLEGGDQAQQDEVQSTEPQEQQEPQEPQEEAKPMGIGQFVRHLLLKSTKTNSEILELVLKTFEGSKTTPACIAWYKTDLRKKGLLEGAGTRGKNKIVEFSAEELADLCK